LLVGQSWSAALSNTKPNPLTADDVHKRVAHGTKAAAKIARELLSAKPGRGLQNSVIGPAVVLVEQPHVVDSHDRRRRVLPVD
jgi:hypothetical protein